MSEIKTVRTSGVIPHTPVIEPLSINQNGTYTAPSGVDGYSPITVDVQEAPWAPLEDGYSNFWFELDENTLSPWLNFSAKNNDAVIDWGDGSGEVALDTLTPTHTYSEAGKYVVKVKGVTGIARQHELPYQGAYFGVIRYIELNDEVIVLSANAFYFCTSVRRIINNVAFNAAPFYGCTSLYSIDIASTNTIVPASAFYFCVSLNNVIIPSSVTEIRTSAFYACSSLYILHVQSTTPPTLGNTVFNGLPSDWICYVPVGHGDIYKAADGWSSYADHIVEEGSQLTRAQLRKISEAEDNTNTEEEEMR